MLTHFQECAEHERCEQWDERREDNTEEVCHRCEVGNGEDVGGEENHKDHGGKQRCTSEDEEKDAEFAGLLRGLTGRHFDVLMVLFDCEWRNQLLFKGQEEEVSCFEVGRGLCFSVRRSWREGDVAKIKCGGETRGICPAISLVREALFFLRGMKKGSRSGY